MSVLVAAAVATGWRTVRALAEGGGKVVAEAKVIFTQPHMYYTLTHHFIINFCALAGLRQSCDSRALHSVQHQASLSDSDRLSDGLCGWVHRYYNTIEKVCPDFWLALLYSYVSCVKLTLCVCVYSVFLFYQFCKEKSFMIPDVRRVTWCCCVMFQISSVIAAGSSDMLPETVRGLRMVRPHLHAVYSTYLLSQANTGVSWKITEPFRLWVHSQTFSYCPPDKTVTQRPSWIFTLSEQLTEDLSFQSYNTVADGLQEKGKTKEQNT